jgi:hypothetical protein
MTGVITYHNHKAPFNQLVVDGTDVFTCSFKEFLPFCSSLYYFSNYKDFNTLTQA